MSRSLAFVLVVSLLVMLVTELSAAHQLARITLHGTGLTAPIEISHDDALREFSVWAGPGAFVDGVEQTEGFIVDWASGPTAAPELGTAYEVRFFESCRRNQYGCRDRDMVLVYGVSYIVDPTTQRGYVYLPGPGDEGYERNGTMLRGGREGNWFRASASWDQYVQGLIEAATAR